MIKERASKGVSKATESALATESSLKTAGRVEKNEVVFPHIHIIHIIQYNCIGHCLLWGRCLNGMISGKIK